MTNPACLEDADSLYRVLLKSSPLAQPPQNVSPKVKLRSADGPKGVETGEEGRQVDDSGPVHDQDPSEAQFGGLRAVNS